MIPPNAAPPKTIVITYPGAEEKIRKQYVYQTYLSPHEHDRMSLVPGNRLVVKFKDEVVGEGQAILRSEERRVGKSVELGGRRMIKKKKGREERTKWTDTTIRLRTVDSTNRLEVTMRI